VSNLFHCRSFFFPPTFHAPFPPSLVLDMPEQGSTKFFTHHMNPLRVVEFLVLSCCHTHKSERYRDPSLSSCPLTRAPRFFRKSTLIVVPYTDSLPFAKRTVRLKFPLHLKKRCTCARLVSSKNTSPVRIVLICSHVLCFSGEAQAVPSFPSPPPNSLPNHDLHCCHGSVFSPLKPGPFLAV